MALGGSKRGSPTCRPRRRTSRSSSGFPGISGAGVDVLEALNLQGTSGGIVPLSELTRVEETAKRHRSSTGRTCSASSTSRATWRAQEESPVYAILRMKPDRRAPARPTATAHVPLRRRVSRSTDRVSHEVGRRMADHLRGVPRPRDRLRGRHGPDLRPGGGLVPRFDDAAHHHGADPAHPGGHPARPMACWAPSSRRPP